MHIDSIEITLTQLKKSRFVRKNQAYLADLRPNFLEMLRFVQKFENFVTQFHGTHHVVASFTMSVDEKLFIIVFITLISSEGHSVSGLRFTISNII